MNNSWMKNHVVRRNLGSLDIFGALRKRLKSDGKTNGII